VGPGDRDSIAGGAALVACEAVTRAWTARRDRGSRTRFRAHLSRALKECSLQRADDVRT
jgi:hypothetical protein